LGTGSPYERRRHRRLPLALPIRFSSRSGAGTSLHGQGLTTDISSGGVRFETGLAQPPAPQTEIAVYITVPRHAENRESSVFLSGRATVVRCESVDPATRHHTGARWSLAARFDAQPDISLPILSP
jgi:hypothetical protein